MNLQPEALAVALAIMVFPHPGGPNNKTPAGKKYEQKLGIAVSLECSSSFKIHAYIIQK